MAKWGEGDPRWIVEERPDAKNVNNWHWTEKNAAPWSKDKIKSLFVGYEVNSDYLGECKITELTRMDGEATANNRKAKLIFLYEWDIKLKWEGNVLGSEDKIEGSIEIPNLSDEFTADEVDISISVNSQGKDAETLLEMMRSQAKPVLKERVSQYIRELKEEFSKGLILPTKDQQQLNGTVKGGDSQNFASKMKKEVVINKPCPNRSEQVGVPIGTTSLELKETFKCRASDIFNAFTTAEMIQAFSRNPCKVDLGKGGQFSLYNGMVEGFFDEIVRDKKLRMRWRLKSYPDGHYSMVLMTFEEKQDCTEVRVSQAYVPESQLDQTESGWKRHYFEAIKVTFGFGAMLF